ncbi:MAG: hypothetical protein IPI63_00835 [Methanothrix sp.]|nr:hypothetical protein [Methanothrix sp.]MBK7385331.1 hypothetical protein [Methanothrix sp.]HPW74115.1 hypothetical protein [Methanothrix sp.]
MTHHEEKKKKKAEKATKVEPIKPGDRRRKEEGSSRYLPVDCQQCY